MRLVRSIPRSGSLATVVVLVLLVGMANWGSFRAGDRTAVPAAPSTPVAELLVRQIDRSVVRFDSAAPVATPDRAMPAVEDEPEPETELIRGGRLTADGLQTYQPNELGYIPVLEYHRFTTDAAEEDQFTRTIEEFQNDLQWLYDHDFYVIPMTGFIRNEIAAPPGKHPVVLSFDDSSPGQFRAFRNERNQLEIDPDSAVGVMETFYRAHPDFGRGGFFAVLPFNCFAGTEEPEQMEYCETKLRWLIANGYEVGNHTMAHQDLLDVPDDEFMRQQAEAILWFDQHAPGHVGTIIAMPYGNYPDETKHPAQRAMLRDGFTYQGRSFKMEAALKVGAEPAVSPSSRLWDPTQIPRIQAFDESLEFWFSKLMNGEVILYTSDGNLRMVTVPRPLPPLLHGELDDAQMVAGGMELIRYNPQRSGRNRLDRAGAPVALAKITVVTA